MSQLSQLPGMLRHHRIRSDIGHLGRGDVLADLFDEPWDVIQQLVDVKTALASTGRRETSRSSQRSDISR